MFLNYISLKAKDVENIFIFKLIFGGCAELFTSSILNDSLAGKVVLVVGPCFSSL